jgi:NAD(P)-dependent dehydrogenase (short-subunit alcohol dehydrogenase family)
LGHPADISEYVYWLCTQNSYITGQNIVIDGGFTCA